MRLATISLLVLPFVLLAARLRDAGTGGDLTLEAIFGGDSLVPSLPEGVLWTPDGSGLLYRESRDGVTRWVRHDVASGETRVVCDWDALLERLGAQRPERREPPLDDVNRTGRFRFDPALSPDGRTLVGVAHGDLFALDLASGEARYLTQGGEPESFLEFSEDGRRLGFVREGDLHWIDMASGEERRVTDRGSAESLLNGAADWVYEEELSVRRSWWWSPDGERIAFLQYDTSPIPVFPITDDMEVVARVERQRYPKAGGSNSRVRLGVVAASGGEPVWLAATADEAYLARAGWTPSGAVWYQWLDRSQDRLELRVVEPDGEGARTLVTESDPSWVNVRDDLHFVDAERFVWSSERDGWRHLYLCSMGGELLRRLTAGPWQVESVEGQDADARHVFFQATERDPRERHLYRVPLAGGPVERLSEAPGTWSGVLAPDGRHLVAAHSSLTRPPQLDLITADGRTLRKLGGGPIAALEEHALPPVELGTLRAADGEILYTAMVRPPDFDPERRHPVLVYVYGGPHAQTVTDAWFDRRQLFFQFLAQQGIVVFWLDNRGTWGRGHAFEAAVHRRLGDREVADQLEGLDWLERQPWVDASRISVYGGSYDAYAVAAFEVDAVDYLLKPIDAAAVGRAVRRLERARPLALAHRLEKLLGEHERRPARRIALRDGGRTLVLRLDDVDRIAAEGNYVRLQVGARSHLLRSTLRDLESRLDPARFVRVHRSTLVNADRVASLQADAGGDLELTLRDGTRLAVSRRHRSAVRRLLEQG